MVCNDSQKKAKMDSQVVNICNNLWIVWIVLQRLEKSLIVESVSCVKCRWFYWESLTHRGLVKDIIMHYFLTVLQGAASNLDCSKCKKHSCRNCSFPIFSDAPICSLVQLFGGSLMNCMEFCWKVFGKWESKGTTKFWEGNVKQKITDTLKVRL